MPRGLLQIGEIGTNPRSFLWRTHNLYENYKTRRDVEELLASRTRTVFEFAEITKDICDKTERVTLVRWHDE